MFFSNNSKLQDKDDEIEKLKNELERVRREKDIIEKDFLDAQNKLSAQNSDEFLNLVKKTLTSLMTESCGGNLSAIQGDCASSLEGLEESKHVSEQNVY